MRSVPAQRIQHLPHWRYAQASSSIDSCQRWSGWAGFSTTIKWHTLLDWCRSVPSFIHVSDGKLGDVNVLDILRL